MIHSHAFLIELTWQVLIEGYLTSLLFVHQFTFELLAEISRASVFFSESKSPKLAQSGRYESAKQEVSESWSPRFNPH